MMMRPATATAIYCTGLRRLLIGAALVFAWGGVNAWAQNSSKASNAQANANTGSSVTGVPNALQGFSQNRGQPIHIDAARLEVRDKDKVATFSGDAKTGDVKVVQGDTVMRSKVLVVFYEDDSAAGGAPKNGTKTSATATPGPGGSQQIRKLEARGNVIVSQKDQTVTGDKGVFDTKANTVTMNGNVVMTQGQNVMQGEALTVDLTTGVSRLEPGKGRVTGFFNTTTPPQGTAGTKGGPSAPAGQAGKPMTLNGMSGAPGR
jgi:lipopolysaccharide export system protein LptA